MFLMLQSHLITSFLIIRMSTTIVLRYRILPLVSYDTYFDSIYRNEAICFNHHNIFSNSLLLIHKQRRIKKTKEKEKRAR
jgi:hypothetical protein